MAHLPHRPSSTSSVSNNPPRERRPVSWPPTVDGRFVPNFSAWQPGDFLLMEARPGRSNPVQTYQKRHPDPMVRQWADWTHCAIYLGDGLMVDTVYQDRVRIRRVFTETDNRRIAVRRLSNTFCTGDERKLLAELAAMAEGVKYASLLQLVLGRLSAQSGTGNLPTVLVCSTLVDWAATRAGIGLSQMVSGDLLPAHLMNHPWLQDVNPVHWCISI